MASHASFILPFLLSSITLHLIILIQIIPSCSTDNYTNCRNLFDCGGKIKNIGFPFWGNARPEGCGYPELHLNCSGNSTFITIQDVKYMVLDANADQHVLRIARLDYMEDLCPTKFLNTSLDHKVFEYMPDQQYQNLTLLYGCPASPPPNSSKFGQFRCPVNDDKNLIYPLSGDISGYSLLCYTSVVVPVVSSILLDNIVDLGEVQGAMRDGFEVKWIVGGGECDECEKSGGVCGYDGGSNQTTCYCQDQSSGSLLKSCSSQGPSEKKTSSKGVIAGVATGVAAAVCILVVGGVCFVVKRRKIIAQQSKTKDLFLPPSSRGLATSTTKTSQSVTSYNTSRSESVQQSFFYGVKVFSYAELEEATKNFDPSVELGNGGFGTVYYGTLTDGRAVAVKRLYESNLKRVEQFKNEVEILARIRHRNLVELYGCTSRHSQELLLVYEYIPNGTVADHLHGNRAKSALLPWSTRLNIAVETAEALSYLHKSDVIHRDVKTNNILLDSEFCVKVADFGLSRLFPNDVTHVSTAPQGTPGYVDPEYYQCYQLTDKSDVYSFGVVLVELISSLEAVDINRHRHDINLANMAVNKIQNHAVHELVDPFLGFERDDGVRKMTTAVAELAFRCLQQDGDIRPSMDEVVEVLRGIQKEECGGGHEGGEKVNNNNVRSTEEVVLLKNDGHPLFSPDSVADNHWVSSSTTTSNSS